jgi:hypothetical protein
MHRSSHPAITNRSCVWISADLEHFLMGRDWQHAESADMEICDAGRRRMLPADRCIEGVLSRDRQFGSSRWLVGMKLTIAASSLNSFLRVTVSRSPTR